MKFFVLTCISLFMTINAQQEPPLEKGECIVHPKECFSSVNPRLFENGGLNNNPRVVARKSKDSDEDVYVRNYGPTYFANNNTLIRALAWNEHTLAKILVTEANNGLLLNAADGHGLTPLLATVIFGNDLPNALPVLLQWGARVQNLPHHTAHRLLTEFFKHQRSPSVEVAELLIAESKPYLSQKDTKKFTQQMRDDCDHSCRVIHNPFAVYSWIKYKGYNAIDWGIVTPH